MEKNPHLEIKKPIKDNSNGLMSTDDPNIDYNQLGDVEYELHFKDLLDESPLFKLGFNPKNIFYQTQGKTITNMAGNYINKEIFKDFDSIASRQFSKSAYNEIVDKLEKGKIPEGDFVFMRSFMLPGDKTKDYPFIVHNKKNLDEAHELSTHMHEFIHRAIDVTPELKEWMTTSGAEPYEEILMAAFTAKYFPQMAEYETGRVQRNYKIDINTEYNKNLLSNWMNEMETIATNNLKKQGRFYEKPEFKGLVKKPKIEPKIEPKIKPKPPIPKKSFVEMIKSLFTGE